MVILSDLYIVFTKNYFMIIVVSVCVAYPSPLPNKLLKLEDVSNN